MISRIVFLFLSKTKLFFSKSSASIDFTGVSEHRVFLSDSNIVEYFFEMHLF